MPKLHQGSRPLLHQVPDGHADRAGDTPHGPQRRVRPAGLDVLIVGSVHGNGEEHALLGEAVLLADVADPAADALGLAFESVVGLILWHPATVCGPGFRVSLVSAGFL